MCGTNRGENIEHLSVRMCVCVCVCEFPYIDASYPHLTPKVGVRKGTRRLSAEKPNKASDLHKNHG